MTVREVNELTPMGEVLDAAGKDGVIVEPRGRAQYALIPLDDDLIDYLLEKSPAFRAECDAIRARVKSGEFFTHEQVKKMFENE